MKNKPALIAAVVLIALFLAAAVSFPLYRALTADGVAEGKVSDSTYSEIRSRALAGDVVSLSFHGANVAVAETGDGAVLRAMVPPTVGARLADLAAAEGVLVSFKAEKFLPSAENVTSATILAVIGNVLVFGLLGAVLYVLVLRNMIASRRGAVVVAPADTGVHFADVAGCDAEKRELEEVVEFLRDPGRFDRLGGRVPTGVLMSGPPGSGKTLLARAVAGEAGVPFFSASGSDFVEMYVGVGASRVRKIFARAKKKAPCILFIDEIDAVGRSRSTSMVGGAHEEREQTLNQLLVEMDGFKPNCGVIVIAATNRPDILDQALTRPGRFSRHIVLNAPDVSGREKILHVHARKIRLDAGVRLSVVARGTPGFSGADLANLVNEAAIMAARAGRDRVRQDDFDHAKDRILLGNERVMVMDEDDRRLTAYHEAGHALVALRSPASDPIHKVTIVPRGRALGMVVRLPERDTPALRRSKLVADLAVAMGGRAAEELIFGESEITTGAAGDIQMATQLARRMVTEWGMSEGVGMLACGADAPETSSTTQRLVDDEIKRLIADGHATARAILARDIDHLHGVARTLLDRESLTGEEIAALIAERPKARPVREAVPAE